MGWRGPHASFASMEGSSKGGGTETLKNLENKFL